MSSENQVADEKVDFVYEMAEAFRSLSDDAARIALGETKTELDLSPQGKLERIAKQAGPVEPHPFQKQLDDPSSFAGVNESVKEEIELRIRESIYNPFAPIPRREFAKALATLQELVQIQGKAAVWKPDSNIGQVVRELTVLHKYRGMTITDDPELLRTMVAVYLWGKCRVCSALAYDDYMMKKGLKLFIIEHEAHIASLRRDEAVARQNLYTLLGVPVLAEEARKLAKNENARSWHLSMILANMKKGNTGATGQNIPLSDSEDSEQLLPVMQQEAFCAWRSWLVDNRIKLEKKMIVRFNHFKKKWAATHGFVTWGEIVKTIKLARFITLWESYETGVRRHSKGRLPAP